MKYKETLVQSLFSIAPDWVNWIAQDKDGAWYGYECKPTLRNWKNREDTTQWYITDGRSQVLTIVNNDWKNSLHVRKDIILGES